MAVWLKLTLAILAGSAGLLVMLRSDRPNEAALEQTVRRELEDLREHLFDR
jgi:hypothetical protein